MPKIFYCKICSLQHKVTAAPALCNWEGAILCVPQRGENARFTSEEQKSPSSQNNN